MRALLTVVVNWTFSRQERVSDWISRRLTRTQTVRAGEPRPRPSPGASLVILNWKRPDNVRRILDAYVNVAVLDDLIVWNNNAASPFEYTHPKVRCINSDDFGLATRWLACLLARHACVIVHDDDLVCDEATINRLVTAHYEAPDRTYTLHGRNPTADNQYAEKVDHVREPTECDVHLTRVACVNRGSVPRYFEAVAEMGLEIDPAHGGGEDIVFSYAVRAETGHRPVVVPGQYTDLIARHAQANRNGSQAAERTRIMQRCQSWLDQPRVKPAI